MAVTRLSNIVVPEIFEDYGSVNKIEKDIFVDAGIAVTSAELNAMLNSKGGKSLEIPYFNQLTFSEPTAANDNPADAITPRSHSAVKDIAMRQPVNAAWSSMDLASELAGADIVGDIVAKVEGFWQTDRQNRVVKSITGVLADSVSNHTSDLLYNISADAGNAVVDANKISGDALIETFATMGDRQDELTGIAVHSVVYKRLQQLGLIDFIRDADNNILFSTYLGKRLIVDDGLYSLSYGSPTKVKYYTIVFGAGAFAMGAGMNYLEATEVDRDPSAGNGSGQELLYSRRQWIIHPMGYKFDYASTTDNAPTYANLIDGAFWTRAYTERKRIKIAALVTNG